MKEVKNHLIAGPVMKNFEFFIQWHLTERCNLRCRHCYQGKRISQEITADEVKHEIDGATEMFQAWEAIADNYSVAYGKPYLFADDPQCWGMEHYSRYI